MRRRLAWLAALALVSLALVFRLALVRSWHASGGDGIQYHRLSQTLRHDHRYAFGPAPAPLSYTRLPGYPIFLAYVAVRRAPITIDEDVRRATRANAWLDVASALVVALALWRLGRRRLPALGRVPIVPWLAFVAVVIAPAMCLLSGYAMTEPLATLLATLEVAAALLALDGHLRAAAVAAGVVAGVSQLVRADAMTFAPAVVIALLAAERPLRARLTALGVFVVLAAAIFAPWPLRNLRAFGEPHPFAAYWRTRDDGVPLPAGPIVWARTWASGAMYETYIDLRLSVSGDLPADVLMSSMWDDEAERARVIAVFARYNQVGLDDEVDRQFRALAAERRARAPFRTYVALPLRRALAMWTPVPYYELPMEVPWAHLGPSRTPFWIWRLATAVLSLVALVALALRRGHRALAALLCAPLVVRTALLSFTVPIGATERHVVELQPLIVVLSAIGLGWAIDRVARMRSDRESM